MAKETFGAWLRYKRTEADLAQDELARRTGLSKSAISMYELDKIAMPRMVQLDKLADGIGIGRDEMRAAFSSRMVTSPTNYGDTESYELANGVTIVFDRRKSKLDQPKRDMLVDIIKIAIRGLR